MARLIAIATQTRPMAHRAYRALSAPPRGVPIYCHGRPPGTWVDPFGSAHPSEAPRQAGSVGQPWKASRNVCQSAVSGRRHRAPDYDDEIRGAAGAGRRVAGARSEVLAAVRAMPARAPAGAG